MIKRITDAKSIQKYSCECKGRNYKEDEVFDVPVGMEIWISGLDNNVSIDVRCPYNVGGHGQRCKAAHPHFDKVEGNEVSCPYVLDLPHAEDFLKKNKKRRILANRDLALIAEEETSLLHPWKHLFEKEEMRFKE